MNDMAHRHLIEAARLTRSGRVTQATALIQDMLRGTAPAAQGVPVPRAERGDVGRGLGRINGLLEGLTEEAPFAGALRRAPLAADARADAPAVGAFVTGNFGNAAGSRPYKLYVPAGYHGQAVPLIVMMHGCTQSPDDFAAGTRMNEAAETENCLVLYPGQTSAGSPMKCWKWFEASEQLRDRGEPSLIADMTRSIMGAYAVDPDRVFAAGLSAGGAACATLAATYPDVFAAIGVHSGLAHGAAGTMQAAMAAMRQGAAGRPIAPDGARPPVPAIIFHGDRDTTVHPSNGEAVAAQMISGARLVARAEEDTAPGGRAYTKTLLADSHGDTVIEHWVVHGLGHAWAGGSASGSYTDSAGPDATAEMLRFFLAHPRGA